MKRFSYVCKLLLIFSLILWQFPAGSSATDLVQQPDRNADSLQNETVDDFPQTAGSIQVTSMEEGINAATLVDEILGEGVEVRNATYTGAIAAGGTFIDPSSTFGFSKGIILSSGAAKGVMGTNTVRDFTLSNETPGDPDLEALLGEKDSTLDAAVLEFEFKPTSDKISFQYVLASEEYPDYLSYSDAFAFFANGENAALIPGTSEHVTITNINYEKNAQYYKSNESGQYQTQMNGMTKVLSAEANVVPGEWNKMKLVIADYGDDTYDSNILIKADSLKAGGAKAGTFKLGGVMHTYDESTGRVTAHTEVIRENGSDGDVTLYWEWNTSEGTMQVAVDFPDGVTKQTLSVDFPKEETMAKLKLLHATAAAGVDENHFSEYLHIKELRAGQAEIIMQEGDSVPLGVHAYNFNEEEVGLAGAEIHATDSSILEYGDGGMLFALGKGESIVSVEYGGHRLSIPVKVMKVLEITQLEVTPASIDMTEGDETPLTITAIYADGSKEDITEQAEISIDDPAIAELSAEFSIIALAAGATEMHVEFAGKSTTVPIEIKAVPKGLVLKIVDEQNSPVHNVSIAIEDEAGSFERFTVNNPYTNELSPGKYKLYIYKQGYQPVYKEIEIKEKQQTVETARLVKAELVSGSWSVEKMTMNEIVEAGIDPNDPENRWVYKFELHLALNGEDHYIPYYINGKGTIYGEDAEGALINGKRYYPVAVPFIGHEDIPPMVGYMIIPGEVSWLKEFFDVELSLTNLAPEPFTLKAANVTLNLPSGLSLAPTADPQTLQFNIGEIAGGQTGKASWVVRGDQKGSYHLSADFSSKLFPFDEDVKASFKTSEPLTVWGDSAIRILAQVESEAHRGMPYLVKFTVLNVSDGPVNDLRLELHEEGKVNYFYSPKQQLEYIIPTLPAGEYKTFEYLLVPTVNGSINLSKSFIKNTGGNATVEIVIATIN